MERVFSPERARWVRFGIPLSLIIVIVFFHTWRLASVPTGIYVDETSIGYNALTIAERGVDEYGFSFPVFFKAFGEYKNPIIIYTIAGLYWLFGPSEFLLRFASALWFFLFLGSISLLSRYLFSSFSTRMYVLLTAGFLPWFFVPSRIAFEVITQLAPVTAFFVCVYFLYHRQARFPISLAIATGFFLGLSWYTYTTARLLSGFLLITWLALYIRRTTLRYTLLASAVCGVTLLPYVQFSLHNSGALTGRFQMLSFLYSPTMTFGDKMITFFSNYVAHFHPTYLFVSGDVVLRHAIGYGGLLWISTGILALCGFVLGTWKKTPSRFFLLVVINFLLTPVAGALTGFYETPSALRSIVMGMYLILLAGYGFWGLITYAPRFRVAITAVLFVALVGETSAYLFQYFYIYPDRSIPWFETYNFKTALDRAVSTNPERIIVSHHGHQAAINLSFYRALLPPSSIPIVVSEPVPERDTCLLFFPQYESAPPSSTLQHTDITPPNSLVHVVCYT